MDRMQCKFKCILDGTMLALIITRQIFCEWPFERALCVLFANVNNVFLQEIVCSANSLECSVRVMVSIVVSMLPLPLPHAVLRKMKQSKLSGDSSVMTYIGHTVQHTLIRCRFSPSHTTGQVWSGLERGDHFCLWSLL